MLLEGLLKRMVCMFYRTCSNNQLRSGFCARKGGKGHQWMNWIVTSAGDDSSFSDSYSAYLWNAKTGMESEMMMLDGQDWQQVAGN